MLGHLLAALLTLDGGATSEELSLERFDFSQRPRPVPPTGMEEDARAVMAHGPFPGLASFEWGPDSGWRFSLMLKGVEWQCGLERCQQTVKEQSVEGDQRPEVARRLAEVMRNADRPETYLSATVVAAGGQTLLAVRATNRLAVYVEQKARWLGPAWIEPAGNLTPVAPLKARSLYGREAWGLFLTEREDGNGNNASGFGTETLVFVGLHKDGLRLEGSVLLGGSTYSRSVGDDGFHLSNAFAMLCPTIEGDLLRLEPSCMGSGEPRFGLDSLQTSCGRVKDGTCKHRFESTAAGTFKPRGDGFVRSALVDVRALARVQPGELEVSERSGTDPTMPADWLEVENVGAQPIDLQSLEIAGLNGAQGQRGFVRSTCVVAPRELVVLQVDSQSLAHQFARRPTCALTVEGNGAALSGTLVLRGPTDRELAISSVRPVDVTLQRDEDGMYCFQPPSPGRKNALCANGLPLKRPRAARRDAQ